MLRRKSLSCTHIPQAWWIVPPAWKSKNQPSLYRKWTQKYIGEDIWLGVWEKEPCSQLVTIVLDILMVSKGVSICGVQSFLTVSVLSLSLVLVIPGVCVCVYMRVWWYLFVFRDFCFAFGVSVKTMTGKEWHVTACFLFFFMHMPLWNVTAYN